MKNKPILVVDSGIGGLTILFELKKMQPKCDYIYFADNKNMPYGNKPVSLIRKELIENIKFIYNKFKPQAIVLACNTATATCINILRKIFSDIEIIGTEPAIVSAINDNKKNILVMATPNTIKYNRNIKKYKDDIDLLAIPDLAMKIEKNVDNLHKLKSELEFRLLPYIHEIDAIVLGCTHYIFLKPILKEICSSDIKIYDGNLGVCKQVIKKTVPQEKEGKMFVLTNNMNCSKTLVSAWDLLKKERGLLCVE